MYIEANNTLGASKVISRTPALLILFCWISLISTAQNKTDAALAKNTVPDATISFGKSNERPDATFTTGTTVYEEVLNKGQLIGLYWSS
ncbi:MAG: hypothetical protein ABI091_26030, partial [Ferruginibacter sp.]